MNLPEHDCSLELIHNEHRLYYQNIENWIKEKKDHYSFESEATKAVCIATNECWTLQWYPCTPIGFFAIAAPTLSELLEFAAKVKKD